MTPASQVPDDDHDHTTKDHDTEPAEPAPSPGEHGITAPSIEQINRLGAVTDLLTAASLLGIGRTKAYQLAQAGTFPVPVVRVGDRYRVPVVPLRRLLGLDTTPSQRT